MDFKNKRGTIDAHNVNLNFKPDNTDSHHIILNFEHLADGLTNLNFGDDVSGVIDVQLDASLSFDLSAIYADSNVNVATIDMLLDADCGFDVVAAFAENTNIIGRIDTVLDADFNFEAHASFVENLCTVDMLLDMPHAEVFAYFDINHLVGVSSGLDIAFKKAITHLSKTEIPWSKPILRVSNEALFFDKGLVISNASSIGFERGLTLSESIHAVFDKGVFVTRNPTLKWQENLTIRIARDLHFDEGIQLRINREFKHQEMIRRRGNITFAHEVAHVFEKSFFFEWDKGLEIVTKDDIPWDKAKAIHYKKHPIIPLPKPETPKYKGSTDLNFNCLCHDVDSHNVVLNFGVDDCIPQKPKKNWWYILNNVTVTRLDNNEPITVIDGTYETGRDRWCWIYSLTVAPDQLHKLQPDSGNPLILKIMINGFEHRMLVEGEPNETRRFAQTLFKFNGRSETALDSETYASKRSFLQENERRAEQLCQAELDRVFSNTLMDWQLLEETGWIVPTQGLTYTNLAPMDAIKLVVEAGGGFIYSHKASKTLSILPKYKKGYWNPMQIQDYDLILDEGVMLQHEIKSIDIGFDYNGITLINSLNGDTSKVRIAGTSAETMLESVTNPLFTIVSMGGYGKTEICKSNVKERHTFTQLPVSQEIGEMLPGKTLAFGGEWWGVIDSVKGSFNHLEVWETVEVERISRE